MDSDRIIVFFAELSTKGKNIMDFIRLLGKNIKTALKDFPLLSYEIKKDHIYILLNGTPYEEVKEKLSKVPGILSFSHAKAVAKDIEAIKEESLELYRRSGAKTFKANCRRVDKDFPLHSDEVNRHIGGKILSSCPESKVDVHHPELMIHVMIRKEGCFVYGIKDKGIGGYPLGIAGKALMLISGGIDSPVAAYLMMKRGVKLEMVHFAAPPYTSDRVIDKIHDLLHVLNDYQSDIKLYIVPFTALEKKVYELAGPSYCVTVMRRMMMRISCALAYQHNDLVLATGESIGQVASQTLYSVKVIEEACSLPMMRPLCTYDKTEIIDLAKKIRTYDISIRPYEDCCTIFTLKDPVTHPKMEKVEEIEKAYDFTSMVKECVRNVKVEHIVKEEKEAF